LLRLFEATAGDDTSSTGRVGTGNHEVSCSQHSSPIGLPLNPIECEKIYFDAICADSDTLTLFHLWIAT
jgi:hypothetical protein